MHKSHNESVQNTPVFYFCIPLSALKAEDSVRKHEKLTEITSKAARKRARFGIRKRTLFFSISDRYVECRCAACALQLSYDHGGWCLHLGHEHTHSGLAAGHRCLHEKAASSAKSFIAPMPPPGPVFGLQLCLARLIFRCLRSRAVSPNDTTTAALHDRNMALPVLSSRHSWSEKCTHFGARFRTQNGSAFRPP